MGVSHFIYGLFLVFCNPLGCAELHFADFATAELCDDAAAPYVEPGQPATFDEQGRKIDAAICRRIEVEDESR